MSEPLPEVNLAELRSVRDAWLKGRMPLHKVQLVFLLAEVGHLDIPATKGGWDSLERILCRRQLAAECQR